MLSASAVVAVTASAPAQAASCSAAGTTGLTAAIVVTANNQTINISSVDANGCDIGIYDGGFNGVTISGVTVTGASDEGILAENATGLAITDNTVENDYVNPNASIPDGHALMLDGVSNSTVSNNTVKGNDAGGIGLADNGPVDPGAPAPGPPSAVTSTGDTISGNTVIGNFGGSAIIAEAWNLGGGVTGVVIDSNAIAGQVGVLGPHGPVIGQILLAGDAAGTSITNSTIKRNYVSESYLTGIALRANAPHDVIANTTIDKNFLDYNNWGGASASPATDGIALIVAPFTPSLAASISGTTIVNNQVWDQQVGVWIDGATSTTYSDNPFGPQYPTGYIGVYNVPTADGGYRLAGSDGGSFAFGNAVDDGSLPGLGLQPLAPVIAGVQTRDRGGYWMVSSDGGVFSFGDATYYGSVPSLSVHVGNIVGSSTTPASPTQGLGTNGLGYWVVGSDGGVFSFGDAKYEGSLPGLGVHVNDIVALVPSPDGLGYWLVASDGGVFSFGDATYYGSLPQLGVHVGDVKGMATTSDGRGYLLAGADGGVFGFGDARYHGSLPGLGVHVRNIVGVASTSDGNGYWLAGSDGGVDAFGDAPFVGSLPGLGVHVSDVVGVART
jgi:parallel beta-helix repeat protein